MGPRFNVCVESQPTLELFYSDMLQSCFKTTLDMLHFILKNRTRSKKFLLFDFWCLKILVADAMA